MKKNNIESMSALLSRLAKEQALDGYEAYIQDTKKLTISLEDDKSIERLHTVDENGIALRTLRDQRLGFAFSFDFSQAAIEEALKRAVYTGSILEKQKFSFLQDKTILEENCTFYDKAVNNISPDARLGLIRNMIDSAHIDKRIVKVEKPSYEEAVETISIINSAGISRRAKITRFGISLSVYAKDGDESQMNWDFQSANTFSELNPALIGGRCSTNAVYTLGGIQLLTGFYDTILSPYVTSQFISVLSRSFLGDAVYKKTSSLISKLNQQVFPEHLNMVDDPALQHGTGSVPFDGEGADTKKKLLVEQGVVKTFLYDTYYANLMNTVSTGNTVRYAISQPPVIGTTNIMLNSEKKANRDLEKILDSGPVITELMGLHTANPVTGEFSLGARGHLIKSGRFASGLKDITVAGNIFDLFNSIELLGPSPVFYGNIYTPSVLVKKLKIAGSN
ncbi:MAG: TldD/PmbA family protein [Deltaproteobacteria bacterium]|nr:TldD/PmbA family protein [Deltaproteobacteria bacterium]MCL5793054.1 TldD/PmbA family protein [Deltaproteobacteria bacterium]